MKAAAIYSPSSRPNAMDRETLIYKQVDVALAMLASLHRHAVPTAGRDQLSEGRSMPGLTQIRFSERVVALGRAAHLVLADVQKRTLIAADLDLEGDDSDRRVEEIEQLVWSCTNTLGIVALGEHAWQSIQLLPISTRRFFEVPPLCLGPPAGDAAERRVLVINHDHDVAKASALAEVLDRCGMEVACIGLASEGGALRPDVGWSDGSFIHIHVGHHTLDAQQPRLVDSWRSERIAFQLIARRRSSSTPDARILMIEDEANGFICETPQEVINACAELLEDRVLQRKLIAAGQNSVAPLVKTWVSIAEELLA